MPTSKQILETTAVKERASGGTARHLASLIGENGVGSSGPPLNFIDSHPVSEPKMHLTMNGFPLYAS